MSNRHEYTGRGFLYVLVAAGPEDMLKVGLTNNPLARWSSFHARWFEVFDLARCMLVETETRADAQALETALHRRLRAHRCPMPLTVRDAAGGGTEWYRGAQGATQAFVAECQAQGYVVHPDANVWLTPVMRRAQQELETLLQQAQEDQFSGCFADARRTALRAWLDAHRLFDPGLDERLPAAVCRQLGL